MSESIEQMRAKAHELVERMNSDAEFQAQVRQNPESTLVAAGLSAEVVPNFLTETHLREAEVSGYLASWCLITHCNTTVVIL
ncbi:MAG: hypothetical protein ACRDHW_07485 [Ktedonobacteraceae bacterium]